MRHPAGAALRDVLHHVLGGREGAALRGPHGAAGDPLLGAGGRGAARRAVQRRERARPQGQPLAAAGAGPGGRAHARPALLLVPPAAARRRHHHHLQLARLRAHPVVPLPARAVRLLPHPGRLHAAHGRRPHLQAALPLPGLQRAAGGGAPAQGGRHVRRGGLRLRAARHPLHCRQHRHHAQVQGRALLGGGADALGLVARPVGRAARLHGAAPGRHPPAPRPLAVGARRHGRGLRPLGPAARGARAQHGGRRQGGGDAVPGHRAGLRDPGAGLRRGARLDECDGCGARPRLRPGHGAREPAAPGRRAGTLTQRALLSLPPLS